MAQRQTSVPYEQHRRAKNIRRETDYQNRRRQKVAAVDNFVNSWEKRPLLCRLHIHRPAVWRDRVEPYESLPRIMPHCGRCGYEWRGYL